MISDIIRSLLRTNTNEKSSLSDEKDWKQRRIAESADAAVSSFTKLMTQGETDAFNDGDEVIDPRFKSHYDQYIRPEIDAFENQRQVALSKLRTRCMIVIPLLLVVAFLFLSHYGFVHKLPVALNGQDPTMTPAPRGHGVSGILGFIAFFLMGWAAWPVMLYKNSIRTVIFPKIFQFFGEKWRYRAGDSTVQDSAVFNLAMQLFTSLLSGNNKAGITVGLSHQQASASYTTAFSTELKDYKSFEIVPGHTYATLNDFLDGDYKTVPIKLLQCHLTTQPIGTQTGQEKSKRDTVFMGLLILLDVPKRFSGHTIIRRDRGAVGNWFGKQFASKLPSVKLEDPRFEQRYEVYGSDQVEARYLLTTSFMERLVALEDLMANHSREGKCNIQCAFKDGKLLFTIPTDAPWFATGSIFKPADFISDINLILQQMDLLFAIIDVLKLDDRTGL